MKKSLLAGLLLGTGMMMGGEVPVSPALGPLMFLFGTESEQVIRKTVDEIADAGNVMLTMESRHHADWRGPIWWRDLNAICDQAKKRSLKVVVFDDPWFPSQMMKGRVDKKYAARMLVAEAVKSGEEIAAGEGFVTAVSAVVKDGALFDLQELKSGTWNPPAVGSRVPRDRAERQCYRFRAVPKAVVRNGLDRAQYSVDGLSEAAVDWFIDYVYEEHYNRLRQYFDDGTIVGFFFDEPESHGDWGPALEAELAKRGIDRLKALVAWKLKLGGGEHTAYKYAFMDARAETWGRVMYGKTSEWCRRHGVFSTGHYMEHAPVRRWFYGQEMNCGNVMQLMKYNDVPGIDLVCNQLYPGRRDDWQHYQMPKIASSIAHTYQKPGDRAMCEIYGAYGKHITMSDLYYLADHHLVRGVNVLIPHAFTTRVGTDIPWYAPYFNDGTWPGYVEWAKHVKEVSAATTEGRHSAQIAFVHPGLSVHLGKGVEPEAMTSLIQEAHYDCDWVNFDLVPKAEVRGKLIRIGREDYPVLMLPGVDAIPYAVLVKAKEFLDAGGVVASHAYRPSLSATVGRTDAEVQTLVKTIFGSGNPRAISLAPVARPDLFTPLRALGVKPTIEIEGEGAAMVHVLRRETATGSTYFLLNENPKTSAKEFDITFTAEGQKQRIQLPPLASKIVRLEK